MTFARPRAGPWLFDVAGLAAALAAGAWALSTHEAAVAGLPWWAQASDAYLWGPDAGEWAMQALALDQGRLGDLDGHRMPTWTMLTVAVMRLTGLDVALAGHLVNRAMHLLLGPVVYGLGRACGMRGGALAAAIMVATHPMLVAAAGRFGVDPTVAFFVPLTLFTGWLSGRWWVFAPVGGVIAGLASASHLTALGFGIPGLLFCVFAGRGWRRIPSALLYALGAWLTLRAVFSVFPFLPGHFLADAFAEGITPAAGSSPTALAATRTAAIETLRANAPAAVDTVIAGILGAFRPPWIPWTLLLFVPWAALVGPAALEPPLSAAAAPRRPPWRALAGRLAEGLEAGLPLLATLAPLFALAAADAPQRYRDNLLPVVAVFVVRGASALVAPLSWVAAAGVRRVAPASSPSALSWPWRAVEGALLLAWALSLIPPPIRRDSLGAVPPEEARALDIGRALAEHFPAGIGAACPIREALPYAGLLYCPNTVCPFGTTEAAFEECLDILRAECRGDGDVPYVVAEDLTPEQQTGARAQLNAWIEARLDPVVEVGSTRIYALPAAGRLGPPRGDSD